MTMIVIVMMSIGVLAGGATVNSIQKYEQIKQAEADSIAQLEQYSNINTVEVVE